MQVTPLCIRCGAAQHGKAIYRPPAEEAQGDGGEIKMRRLQNGFGADEP